MFTFMGDSSVNHVFNYHSVAQYVTMHLLILL